VEKERGEKRREKGKRKRIEKESAILWCVTCKPGGRSQSYIQLGGKGSERIITPQLMRHAGQPPMRKGRGFRLNSGGLETTAGEGT